MYIGQIKKVDYMKKKLILLTIGLMFYINGCAFISLTSTSLTNDKSKNEIHTSRSVPSIRVG